MIFKLMQSKFLSSVYLEMLFLSDNNLISKNEKELENLIQAVRIYSENIEMEFGIEKCVMLKRKAENDN